MNDLRALTHFLAVYQTRSFRTAAEELGLSQSALTKSIQRLETDLGLRLFNRTTRSVEPTDGARHLLPSAERALQTAREFEQEARALGSGQMGAVRVGVIALASETVLAPSLARLARDNPQIEVEITVGSADIYQDLAAGQCDIAVGDEANFRTSPHAPHLRKTPLAEEPLVVVTRRRHPALPVQSVRELRDFPWAIPSRYFNENQLFRSLAATNLGEGFPRYRLTSLTSCLDLAAASDTVTVAPRSVVEKAHRIRALTFDPMDLGIRVKLALFTVARNAQSPAIRAFLDAARSATR